MFELETIRLDVSGPMARVTPNRPEVLNAGEARWVRDRDAVVSAIQPGMSDIGDCGPAIPSKRSRYRGVHKRSGFRTLLPSLTGRHTITGTAMELVSFALQSHGIGIEMYVKGTMRGTASACGSSTLG